MGTARDVLRSYVVRMVACDAFPYDYSLWPIGAPGLALIFDMVARVNKWTS